MEQMQEFLAISEGPQSLIEAIQQGTIDPDSARWVYNMMQTMGGEASELSGQGKGAASPMLTSAEALERFDEISRKMGDMSPGSPDYQDLMVKRTKYMQMANRGR
jgi:hypothetical protein